ncbi:MAG: carbohydrate ABC transporter substrate-binding protein [Symploca sp. SIO2E6]|nr:carbohydrate ABC transporter substrate-binding protein [Symploca sp. SIO2E6]
MRLRRYLFILLFLLSFVLLTCTNGTNTPKRSNDEPAENSSHLTIWWNRGYYVQQDEAIEQVVNQWQDTFPQQKAPSKGEVKLFFYSEDDLLNEIINALEEGNPPDILFSERTDFTFGPSWAWEGKLADVSDVIEPVKDSYSSSAIASVYLYNRAKGKRSYYAVPLKQQTIHIHYWRSLLSKAGIEEEIPQEWNAFWEFWKQAQDSLRQQGQQDIYGIGLPMSADSSDTYFAFEQALEAYDVQLLDKNGQLLLNNAQVRQGLITTLDWYTSFYQEGYVPPAAVDWLNADNNTAFLNGTVLMTLNPSLSIPGSQREDEDIYRNQIATIEFPQKPDGEKLKYLVSVKQVVIFASSKNQEAAKDFLSYLVQPENLGSYVKGAAGRYFPVMPQLWEDGFWQESDDPHVGPAAKQFSQDTTRTIYQVRNSAYSLVQSENVWGKAIERVIIDGLSPEEAADEAINRIEEIFADWSDSD